jgi:hypothetical protein
MPCVVARPNTCVKASRTGVSLTSLADVTTIWTSCPGSKNQKKITIEEKVKRNQSIRIYCFICGSTVVITVSIPV